MPTRIPGAYGGTTAAAAAAAAPGPPCPKLTLLLATPHSDVFTSFHMVLPSCVAVVMPTTAAPLARSQQSVAVCHHAVRVGGRQGGKDLLSRRATHAPTSLEQQQEQQQQPCTCRVTHPQASGRQELHGSDGFRVTRQLRVAVHNTLEACVPQCGRLQQLHHSM